jgi:hypothetical protein
MKTMSPRSLAVVVLGLGATAEASAPAGRYKAANGTVFDTKTKLTWERAPSLAPSDWPAADTYCHQTVGAKLGGTGWRLPTIKELQTLVDDSRVADADAAMIDPTAFPGTPAGPFWSSSPLVDSPGAVWCLFFLDGSAAGCSKADAGNHVRCVR